MNDTKKLRIKYLGQFSNPFSDSTEKHIAYSLREMGHEVIEFDEKKFDTDELIKEEADLFLFHKGGTNHGVELPELVEILNNVTCPKVFWWFDKIDRGERQIWMDSVIPFVDWGFLTDGSFIRRRNEENLTWLLQGIGNEDTTLGEFQEKFDYDVVFTGSVYADRQNFVEGLKGVYGDRFKLFNNVFNRDLYDLAASAKIFVAPRTIQNDFYWSSRVYMTLGSGGFMLHPKLEGMKQHFEDKKHLAFYHTPKDMLEKIDYYLKNEKERKKIQMAGYKHVVENHTYAHRMQVILNCLYANKVL